MIKNSKRIQLAIGILSFLILFMSLWIVAFTAQGKELVKSLEFLTLQSAPEMVGRYSGTLAITSPVNLGVVDFAIELDRLGNNIGGSVFVTNTAHFSNTPQIIAFITGATNDITPTFSIQSIPMAEIISGQPVTRTFSIEGEIVDNGNTLVGVYTEEIIGYANKPLHVEGLVRLLRPSAALLNGNGASSLQLSAVQSFVAINQTVDIGLTVKDGDGIAIANETVLFTTDLGSISPNPAITDLNGKATVTFSAGNTLGIANIQAQSDQGLTHQIDMQVTPDVVIGATADKSLLPTGGSPALVTFAVTNGSGVAQANVEIDIEAQLGTIDQTRLVTNGQGQASVTFASGLTPGFGIVKASYLGVSEQIAIPIEIRRIDDVQLTMSSLALNVGESTALNFVVRDQFGSPMSGELVTFFATHGAISPDNALTNSEGRASATFTAGNSFGSANIQALVGSSSDSATVQIVDPASISITSINPSEGSRAGGDVVSISGRNFDTGATVLIGGRACLSVQFMNSFELLCSTPVGVVGSADVTVQNPDGELFTASSGFAYLDEIGPMDSAIYLPIIEVSE